MPTYVHNSGYLHKRKPSLYRNKVPKVESPPKIHKHIQGSRFPLPPWRQKTEGVWSEEPEKSTVPSRRANLGDLIGLPMGDDTFVDVKGIDQVLPGLEIEVEDALVFLDAFFLDLGGFAGGGAVCICFALVFERAH